MLDDLEHLSWGPAFDSSPVRWPLEQPGQPFRFLSRQPDALPRPESKLRKQQVNEHLKQKHHRCPKPQVANKGRAGRSGIDEARGYKPHDREHAQKKQDRRVVRELQGNLK